MDFDEWEKMKEYERGRGANQSLYDAVGKTVSNMYAGINNYWCDSCNSGFRSDSAECTNCGSWDTREM